MIKGLGKTRPHFGGSVTQNTEKDHTHTLENFTGNNLKRFKKDAVLMDRNGPNIPLRQDISRNQDFNVSSIRNNELPFRQVHTSTYQGHDDHVLGDHRHMSEIKVRRQNLKGFSPTGYSHVRKPASLATTHQTKKHDPKFIDSHRSGRRNTVQFLNHDESSAFTDSKSRSRENIYNLNKMIPNSNNKASTPVANKQKDSTILNFENHSDRHYNLHKLNEITPTYKNHNKTIQNEESYGGLSFPRKIDIEHVVNASETAMSRINDREMKKFVPYETFSGNDMSFQSKNKETLNQLTSRDRIYNVNNASGKITSAKSAIKGVKLGGAHVKNTPDQDFISNFNGNKKVHNMEDFIFRPLPERSTHADRIHKSIK